MRESRILAIDYGEKRVGLALSDPLKIIASPFRTLQNSPNLLNELALIIREQCIELVVLGYPVRASGVASSAAGQILKFRQDAEQALGIPVILFDERFTSSLAMERIMAKTKRMQRKADKGLIDKNAAAILLEDFLRTRKS